MAQLRAKQIKLAAQDDLLIGGANGNGTVLTKGTAGQVLKVLAGGGLGYEKAAAADTTFTGAGITATNVQAAIVEVKGLVGTETTRATTAEGLLSGRLDTLESQNLNTRLTTAEGEISGLQTEVNAIETGAGLGTDGAYTANGSANYIAAATSLKDADNKLDAALKSLADDIAAIGSGSISDLQDEVNAIETAVGLNANGTLAAFATGGHAEGKTSFKAAVEAIDAALVTAEGDIDTLQTQVSALAGLGALHFVGTIAGNISSEDLGALSVSTGDVYRVITAGSTDFGGTGLEVNIGDYVVKTTTDWVKFDNTDPTVTTSDTNLLITGDAHAGYEIALRNKGDVTSTTTAITVTDGTGVVLSDMALTFNPGNVNFSALAQTGAPGASQDGKFLKWDNTAQSLVYVTAAELGATVRAEEDFTPTTAANAAVTLAHTPTGDIQVFINGVKLKKSGFTVSGTTVTLVDTNNGYGIETGDTLSVSYSYAA